MHVLGLFCGLGSLHFLEGSLFKFIDFLSKPNVEEVVLDQVMSRDGHERFRLEAAKWAGEGRLFGHARGFQSLFEVNGDVMIHLRS